MLKKMNVFPSLLLIVFLIFSNLPVALAIESSDGIATQQSMSAESCQAYHQQDEEMNDLYRSLKKSYKEDRYFLKRLKKAQKRWLKFRDAHVDTLYPKAKNDARTASNRTMCRCILLAAMTETRNNQLGDMLMAEEGDVCALPAPAMADDVLR